MVVDLSARRTLDRDYHDAIAAEYDATVVVPRSYANTLLFSHLMRGMRGATALDLGCGTGHMLLRLAPRFDQVIGVDHSAGMMAIAASTLASAGHRNVRCVQHDVLQYLAERSEPVQGLTAVGFLHHLHAEERAALFAHAHRLLDDHASLIVAEPMQVGTEVPPKIQQWNAASPLLRTHYSIEVEDPDEAPLDEAPFRAMLHEAGLIIVQEARSWEILNHSPSPGWIESLRMRQLFRRYRGEGNVLALRLMRRR